MKKEVYHFYYSEKQAFIESSSIEPFEDKITRTHFNTFIDENGKERIYTELRVLKEGEKPESNGNFSDFQYLGTGTIHTVNGIKQNIDNNIEITETVQDASYSHFSQNFYKTLLFKELSKSSRDIKLPDINIDLEPQIKYNNIEVEGDPKPESMVVSQLLEKKINNSQSEENNSTEVNFQLLKDPEMPKFLKDAHTKEYDKNISNKFKNRKPK
tara:strand:+ start:8896 stop:9534 length:639 start_codon:yes stop_codon:yes gene_type:complete